MPHPEQPSYEELAARNAELLAVVAEQAALIESLRAEVAALRRQAGRDSSNSSQPPSQDGPAAEAKAKAGQREARRARPGRAQGGQKGHPGASLAWAARPDETRVIEPGTCGGCGADLAGAAGPGRFRRAGLRYPAGRADGDGVPDDAPHLRVRAGHDRPAAAGSDRRPGLLRPERGGCGDAAGQHGRDRDRAGRGPDGRPAQGAGLHGVRVAVPGPPGRGVNRRRVRGRAQGRPEGGGRARHRRDPRPADHRGDQRGGLREPARLHGADHARLYRRRAGPDLVRRGGQPHQGVDHRLRDPGRLPRGPGPRRLRRLPQLRRRARRRPAVPGPPVPVPRRRLRDRPGIPGLDPAGRRRPPRGRAPPSGPPATPARPAWTPPSWPGCATATTRPSPSGSR